MEGLKQYAANSTDNSNKLIELASSRLTMWWILVRALACILLTVVLGMTDKLGVIPFILVPWVIKLIYESKMRSRLSAGQNVNLRKYVNVISVLKIFVAIIFTMVLFFEGTGEAGPEIDDTNYMDQMALTVYAMIIGVPSIMYQFCMRSTYKKLIGKDNCIVTRPPSNVFTITNLLKIFLFGWTSLKYVLPILNGYKFATPYYVITALLIVCCIEAKIKYDIIQKVAE